MERIVLTFENYVSHHKKVADLLDVDESDFEDSLDLGELADDVDLDEQVNDNKKEFKSGDQLRDLWYGNICNVVSLDPLELIMVNSGLTFSLANPQELYERYIKIGENQPTDYHTLKDKSTDRAIYILMHNDNMAKKILGKIPHADSDIDTTSSAFKNFAYNDYA